MIETMTTKETDDYWFWSHNKHELMCLYKNWQAIVVFNWDNESGSISYFGRLENVPKYYILLYYNILYNTIK